MVGRLFALAESVRESLPYLESSLNKLVFVLLACLVLTGCRSVWVHPEWEQGKYEEDLGECYTAPNWKTCMMARGWYTETDWRSAPRTRPAKPADRR